MRFSPRWNKFVCQKLRNRLSRQRGFSQNGYVLKLRLFAIVLLSLAGCATAPHRGEDWRETQTASPETASAAEMEHVTEAPTLAPPAGAIPEIVQPATNHAAGIWISLRRWSAENHLGSVQRLSAGPVPTFALKTASGLLIIHANNVLANWNGLEFHLGFPPQLINNEPFVHSLDLSKSIQPLLHGLSLPEKPNRVVVIDPGHGGQNYGTKSSVDEYYEKDYALDWAKRLAPLLASNGWQVFLTRTNDSNMELSNRVAFAEEHKADLFISLHFNAVPGSVNPSQAGIETYCLTPAGMSSTLKRDYEDNAALVFPNNRFDAENWQLAVAVHHALMKVPGAFDHGVRRARFMGVLRGQNRPAILVEGGYLSNPREAKRIADPAYRQKLAEAIATALTPKPQVPQPKPAPEESTNNPPAQ